MDVVLVDAVVGRLVGVEELEPELADGERVGTTALGAEDGAVGALNGVAEHPTAHSEIKRRKKVNK